MSLLKDRARLGLGGIYLDDVQESLPRFESVMKKYEKHITTITRPSDKKKVIYYNNPKRNITVI